MKYYTIKEQQKSINESWNMFDIGLTERARLIKDFANTKRSITKEKTRRA
jgi:hypothetical protein